jgi:hypothetical protein
MPRNGRRSRLRAAGGNALALALAAPAAHAHGFGQRFDLPLPLWLWIGGAAATIVATFVLVGVFAGRSAAGAAAWRVDLLSSAAIRRLAHPLAVALRSATALVFLLALGTGFFGKQDPYANIIVVAVWIVWWVGVAFICALIGDVWEVVDPLRSLYRIAARAVGRILKSDRMSLGTRYPPRWAAWPAVLLFGCFAWAELVWRSKDVPAALAGAVLGYALVSWLGMLLFGVDVWRRHGDAFAIAFRVLARFAPLEIRSSSPGVERRLVLRPYGGGILDTGPVPWSMVVFVLVLLATVTFDGFQQTPAMQRLETAAQTWRPLAVLLFELSTWGLDENQIVQTATLLAFPIAFVAVYASTSAAMDALGSAPDGGTQTPPAHEPPTVTTAAGGFVMTLVPIAVAYHLSHYLSLLLTTGQFVVPLVSDPFGWGWNLFGTRTHAVDLAVLNPYVYWYGSVLLIVFGHILAVVAAHRAALRLFGSRRRALRSQIPMLALMVVYTTISLWILAQPIVE